MWDLKICAISGEFSHSPERQKLAGKN